MEHTGDSLFHDLTIEDLEWCTEIEKKADILLSDQTFANYLLWTNMEHTQVARISDCMVCRIIADGKTWFTYPVSGSEKNRIACLGKLNEMCENEGIPLRFRTLTAANCRELNACFKYVYEMEEARERFDYVYKCRKLAELKGKRLAAKRNHIHRFEDGGDWNYESLDNSNLEDCWKLELNWLERQGSVNDLVMEEKIAIRRAMDYFDVLNLSGGLIRRDGEVVAFCIGERLNKDTFVVHFEKAYADIQGAYQILNQQFAVHNLQYLYMNREYDAGDLGLRKAKMSYYPEMLVKNYVAQRSGFYYATYADLEDIVCLWNACFGDDRSYILDYFEDMFRENSMLCICREGKIVSMASFLRGKFKNGSIKQKVIYVYAVATLPGYRGRGYMGRILQYALNKYSEPLVLYPADSYLEEDYAKAGFKRLFPAYEKEYVIGKCGIGTEYSFQVYEEVSDELAEAYMDSRKSKLKGRPHIEWGEKHIRYALWDVLGDGGSIFEFECGFILGIIKEGEMYLVESTVWEPYFMDCLYSIGKYCGITICREKNLGAMILQENPTDEECYEIMDGYLGLSLG